jgi:hypothetical protein
VLIKSRTLLASIIVFAVLFPACDPTEEASELVPFSVTLDWDERVDMDLHVWLSPSYQCSQDRCPRGTGIMSSDDTDGSGREQYSAPVQYGDNRYRVGVNLHWYEGPEVVRPRTATLDVFVVRDSLGNRESRTHRFGPYLFEERIDDGGYPVIGNTRSWWRPVDIVMAGDSIRVESPDNTPLGDPPS